MPKRILRPLLAATVLLLSAACSSLTTTGESVALVTYNGAPQISIVSPQANARYREGANVYIVARVENAGPDISSMVVRIGDEVIAQTNNPATGGGATFAINAQWPAQRSGSQIISVSVQRADPSLSDMKTVDIEVIGSPTPTPMATVVVPTIDAAPAQPTTDTSSPAVNAQPTSDTAAQPAAPTTVSEPPTQAVPPTASAPQVKVKQGANVRKGPATSFEPPLGSMAAGQTAEILGKNLDGTWYKIRFYNGEGWIAALTVDVEGNVSNLVAEAGPATPIPAPPTAVVPTGVPVTAPPAAPSTGPDLVVVGIKVDPHPFVCNEGSNITVTVKNNGTAASVGTEIVIQDLFNGQPGANTRTIIGAIQPGQTADSGLAALTVATNYSQGHVTRAIVDPNANNTETNETNNQLDSAVYTLAQGNCP